MNRRDDEEKCDMFGFDDYGEEDASSNVGASTSGDYDGSHFRSVAVAQRSADLFGQPTAFEVGSSFVDDPYQERHETAQRSKESSSTSECYHLPPLSDEPMCGWKNELKKFPPLPLFHPLEMSHVKIPLNEFPRNLVLNNITKILRTMSVQATFEHDPPAASLFTSEGVDLYLPLWESNDHIIIEAQRVRGNHLIAGRYSRKILDAATGYFGDDEIETVSVSATLQTNSFVQQTLERSPTKPFEDDRLSNSLNMIACDLRSPRLDLRRSALEWLCLMADPTRSTIDTCVAVCLAVLFGKAANTASTEACQTIHKSIIKLVQLREFDDGSISSKIPEGFKAMLTSISMFPSDDDDDFERLPLEYAVYRSQVFHLALTAMVQAIEVMALYHGHQLFHGLQMSSVNDTFLAKAKSISGKDMIETLTRTLNKAERNLHNAMLSTKALNYLCKSSEQVCNILKAQNISKVLHHAAMLGSNSHVALYQEAEKLWQVVH